MTLFKKILFTLIIVAAVSVLLATLWLPVMSVNGTSMEPVLSDGDIIVAIKNLSAVERGDIVAFYYNDKVLLKRVIGLPGDTVDMDDEGNVYIDGEMLEEPYLREKSLGITNVEFPVEVTENSFFVMGDNRSVSVDSRSTDLGNVYFERVIGKIVLRIFPLSEFEIM